MARENIENHLAVLFAAARRNLMAEHHLFAIVVHPRAEDELAAPARLIYGPTREAAGDFLHVLLSVAAFDPQRVKLHQLARVVLVDARLAFLELLRNLRAALLFGARLLVIAHLIAPHLSLDTSFAVRESSAAQTPAENTLPALKLAST